MSQALSRPLYIPLALEGAPAWHCVHCAFPHSFPNLARSRLRIPPGLHFIRLFLPGVVQGQRSFALYGAKIGPGFCGPKAGCHGPRKQNAFTCLPARGKTRSNMMRKEFTELDDVQFKLQSGLV